MKAKKDKFDQMIKIKSAERFLGAILGTLIYAVGINLFVVPTGLYTGGIMGFCQLIRTLLSDVYHIQLPGFDIAGIIYYIINIPIFILAFVKIGAKFFAKTLVCVTTMTLFLSLVPIPVSPILPNDSLASCVIGGILCGFGIGFTLVCGASGGGMDVIGILLIRWRSNFSVGRVNLFINILLYGICLFLFNVPTVIYSLIYASVSAVAVDRVHSQNINVEVKVITKKDNDELEQIIFNEMKRGITKWESLGAYTHEGSWVLLVLMSKYEVNQFKQIIHKYDPHAFIVVNEGVSVDGHFLKKV